MNTIAEKEINPTEMDFIASIKNQVDQIYSKHGIFGLSLETLELTRRFNNFYSRLKHTNELPEVEYNRFLVLARHLERNLVQELT